MIKVTIRDKYYALKDTWDDVTLNEFQQLLRIPIPVKLQRRWMALLSDNESDYDSIKDTNREIIKVYPEYFGKVIALLSDIPAEVINCIEWSLREKLFNEYLIQFSVTSLAHGPLIFDGELKYMEPRHAYAFTFKEETYNLPESLMYGGREIPQRKEKIVTFAESADINIALQDWKDYGIDAMAQVCANYLRKEGEEYSEELIIERTEQFKELPMSVVWEVFFCIISLGLKYENVMQSFLSDQMQKLVKQLEEAE